MRFTGAILIAFSVVFTASTKSLADDRETQINRFLPFIEQIDEIMKSSRSSTKVRGELLSSGARVSAFSIQGLARLYEDRYPFFKELHDDFKKIEDFIGKIDQWKDELGKAEEALKKSKSEKNKERVADAKTKLASLYVKFKTELKRRDPIAKRGEYEADKFPWVSSSSRWRKTEYYMNALVNEFPWKDYSEDRRDILEYELGEIEKIEREYDPKKFDNLELDNGIHSFRKDLRWILIEMRTSNGLFTFRSNPNQCDIKAYENLPFEKIAESKYAMLATNDNEPEPCAIQQCVFLGLVNLQNAVADIKDDMEGKITEKDRYKEKNVLKYLPEKMKDMEKIYSKYLKNDTWKVLKSQLKECRD